MNEILNKDDKKRDSSLGQLTVVLCCTKIFKPNNVAIHTKKNQRKSYYNFCNILGIILMDWPMKITKTRSNDCFN